MKYKGYHGSIKASEKEGILYGKVLGIKASITYEGKTIEELKRDFKKAIDFYIEECKKNNIKPDKPFSGQFKVRMNSQLHKELSVTADKKGISLNQVCVDALEKEYSKSK